VVKQWSVVSISDQQALVSGQ